MKKLLCTMLALAAFLLVTSGFVRGLQDSLSRSEWGQEQRLTYTVPETLPSETAAAQTLPPETIAVTEPSEPITTEPIPDQTLPVETTPPTTEPAVVFRYGDLSLSQDDQALIAKLVCLEGAGESPEGQQAIAEVILNRIVADNFPSSAKGVIFAEGQFLSAGRLHQAQPTQDQFDAVDRAYHGPYILDLDVVFFSQYAVNDNIWGTIGNHIFCRQW